MILERLLDSLNNTATLVKTDHEAKWIKCTIRQNLAGLGYCLTVHKGKIWIYDLVDGELWYPLERTTKNELVEELIDFLTKNAEQTFSDGDSIYYRHA